MCCSRRRQRLLEERKKQQQQRTQPKPSPRSPVVRDPSVNSSVIASALRSPSPSRSPQRGHSVDEINAEVLSKANIQPPSYEDVMTEGKAPSQAGEPSHQRAINAYPTAVASSSSTSHKVEDKPSKAQESFPDVPDNVTVFSEDPAMYTPPTTRAPTVIHEDDHDARTIRSVNSDSTVDSVIEEFRRWETQQSGSSGSASSWREHRSMERAERKTRRSLEKSQRKAEQAARKAEKWAARAVKQGYVFENGGFMGMKLRI